MSSTPSASVAFATKMRALLHSRAAQRPVEEGFVRCPLNPEHHVPRASIVSHIQLVHLQDSLALASDAMYSNDTASRRHEYLATGLYHMFDSGSSRGSCSDRETSPSSTSTSSSRAAQHRRRSKRIRQRSTSTASTSSLKTPEPLPHPPVLPDVIFTEEPFLPVAVWACPPPAIPNFCDCVLPDADLHQSSPHDTHPEMRWQSCTIVINMSRRLGAPEVSCQQPSSSSPHLHEDELHQFLDLYCNRDVAPHIDVVVLHNRAVLQFPTPHHRDALLLKLRCQSHLTTPLFNLHISHPQT